MGTTNFKDTPSPEEWWAEQEKKSKALGYGKHIHPLDKQVSGSHYKNLAIQPIEYIHANKIPFAEGCAIKYLTRWRDKGGIADLEKAKHFIELLIALETKAEYNERVKQATNVGRQGGQNLPAETSIQHLGNPSNVRTEVPTGQPPERDGD